MKIILNKIINVSQYIIALLLIMYICAIHYTTSELKINYILVSLYITTGISVFNMLVFIYIQKISQSLILLTFVLNLLLISMTNILIDIISDKAVNNASFIWTGKMDIWDISGIIFILITIVITIIVILKNTKTINDEY